MIARLLLTVTAISILGPLASADGCRDKVMIDSVEYTVGEMWCGKKLDSTQLADKNRLVQIPDEYTFEDYHIYVDRDARDAFVRMADSARKDTIKLIVDSGYRSAKYQERIIKAHMSGGDKFSEITRYVAPPGYSDHETGRTVDFVPSDPSFARTDAYRWLVENAGKFDFVQSFPKDTAGVMPWEPWHWTYAPGQEQ